MPLFTDPTIPTLFSTKVVENLSFEMQPGDILIIPQSWF